MTLSQLSSHLSVPLYRNGYALVANTVVTAGLGALYWVVAARFFSAEAVGINAAALSVMVLIANLSQLNLKTALNRFVPDAGGWTSQLIGGAYLVAAPVAVIASIVFLIGQPTWAPGLEVLRSSPLAIIGFVAATTCWTVFVLQDAALTGLRKATWIPPENTFYGLAKIGLLFAFAVSAPTLGIFASATLPLLFVIVPVNVLIFRRAVPHHVGVSRTETTRIDSRIVARFAAADFFASLSSLVSISLMPVLVLSFAGAEANAYFFLAWTIAYTLYLIGSNTGMSLITEAALAPHKLQTLSRRVLLQTSGIVIPTAAALAVFAPLVLGIFGPDYASQGSAVLRLLVLAAIPHTVFALNVSMLRAEQRMRALAILYGGTAILVILLSVVLLPVLGINGVGWAWLITMTLVAGVVLLTDLRFLWLQAFLDGPVGRRITSMERTPQPEIASGPDLAGKKSILSELRQSLDRPGLKIVGRSASGPEVAVVFVGTSPNQPEIALKIAQTEFASASLLREANALAALHADSRMRDLARFAPKLLASGSKGGHTFVAQSYVGGAGGRTAERSDRKSSELLITAGRAITGLHRATQTLTVLTDDGVPRQVDRRIEAALRDGRLKLTPRHAAALSRMQSELRSTIVDRRVSVGWIHGDYWFGNVLIDRAGETCGIVDWGGMQITSLPGIDLVHLILTTRAIEQNLELGAVVLAALDDDHLSDVEAAVMAMLTTSDTVDDVPWRALVLLTWVHHVTSRARYWSGSAGRWLWTTRNVGEVLEAL